MYIEKSVLWPNRKQPVLSLGRNGDIVTAGMVIMANERDVDLCPITSRNKVGKCVISLPSSPAIIRDLAKKLESLAKEIEDSTEVTGGY